MTKVFGAAALAFSLISATVSGALAQEKKVTSSELNALFPGSFMAIASGMPVTIVASGNGTLRGQMKGYKDTGRWQLSGGRLCITWDKWLNGKTSCSMVVADNGWYRGSGVKFRKL